MTSVIERPADPSVKRRHCARGKDRRGGLHGVLSTLVHSLREGKDSKVLRWHLERGVCQALSASRVLVREESEPYHVEREEAEDEGRICVDIPRRLDRPRALLEARFREGRALDDWGLQIMQMAAHLAALVLELAEGKGGGVRPATVRQPPALIGSSPPMCVLRESIQRIAETDFTVLIQGESGTGKELVARQVHELSRRRCGPFVAVNCAAIVDSLLEAELFGIEDRTATGVRGRRGKFEIADGGTLFLDEVSDLAPAAQAKLLRAIQELTVERVGGHTSRQVDVRIIVATNRSLCELTKRGEFRADLFYRLSGVELHVPPLRQRREDINELAAYFLSRHRGRCSAGFDHAATEALLAYDWPGNVRELERLIEGIVALTTGERVTLADLPPSVRGDYAAILLPSRQRNDTLRAWGARYVRLVLDSCGGSKRRACNILDISYHTLQAYLDYQIERTESTEAPAKSGPTPETDDETTGYAAAFDARTEGENAALAQRLTP